MKELGAALWLSISITAAAHNYGGRMPVSDSELALVGLILLAVYVPICVWVWKTLPAWIEEFDA